MYMIAESRTKKTIRAFKEAVADTSFAFVINVGVFIESAYQNQSTKFLEGSKIRLLVIPCISGGTPVIIDVCAG